MGMANPVNSGESATTSTLTLTANQMRWVMAPKTGWKTTNSMLLRGYQQENVD